MAGNAAEQTTEKQTLSPSSSSSSSTTKNSKHNNHNESLETQSSKLDTNNHKSTLPLADISNNGTTTTTNSNGNGNGNSTELPEDVIVVYDVEHLATFSTSTTTTTTNGSHETTNNRSKQQQQQQQQVNNDSKSKLPLQAKVASVLPDDDDDPAAAVTSNTETAYYGKTKSTAQTFDGCGITTPKVALRRLFELEKLSGIWTQRMQIELRLDSMLIVDCETNSVVEKFDKNSVTKPEAFNEYNHIYNNIVVFIINQQQNHPHSSSSLSSTSSSSSSSTAKSQQARNKHSNNTDNHQEINLSDEDDNPEGELHIFQCVHQQAQQLVQDILDWKSSKLQVKVRNLPTTANHNSTSSSSSPLQISKQISDGNDMAKLIINSSSGISSKYEVNKSLNNDNNNDNKNSKSNNKQNKQDSSKSRISPATNINTNSNTNTNRPMVTVASSSSANENVPVVNVNVKETVQVFNQIAALREKSKPASPTNGNHSHHQQQRPLSDASATSSTTNSSAGLSLAGQHQQQQQQQLANGSGREEELATLEGGGASSFFKQRSIRAKLSAQDQQQQKLNRATTTTNISSSTTTTTTDSTTASCYSSSDQQQTKQLVADCKQNNPDVSSSTNRVVQQSFTNNNKMSNNNNNNSNINKTSSTSSSNASSSSTNRSSSGFDHHLKQQQQQQQQHHHHHHHSSSKHNHNHNQHHRQQQLSSSSRDTVADANANVQQISAGKSATSSSASKATKQATRSTAAAATVSSKQRSSHLDQVTTNESYVSVLNHCFDDIEKFILKLQQSMAASRELQQAKRKLSKRSSQQTGGLDALPQPQLQPLSSSSSSSATGTGTATATGSGSAIPLTASEMALLNSRARGPNEEDYFEILSKFKLAFNLLAKLKGCIHEPNAPELVHFLFTPLAIIIESARNAKPAIDPTLVGIPYLNQDALDLLSNCCTSKEYDMWISLGPNWIQTIDTNLLKASRLPSSFQPIFSDGWAPIIGELELIGLVVPPQYSSPVAFASGIGNYPGQPEQLVVDELQPQASNNKSERQHRHRHKQHQDHPMRTRHPSAGGYPLVPEVSSSPMNNNIDNNNMNSAYKRGQQHALKNHIGHNPVSRHLSEPAVAAAAAGPIYGHDNPYNYADPTTIDAINGGATSPYRSSHEIYHRPVSGHHQHHRPSGSSNRSGSVERRSKLLIHSSKSSHGRGVMMNDGGHFSNHHHQHHQHHQSRGGHHELPPQPPPLMDHHALHHYPPQPSMMDHRASDRYSAAPTAIMKSSYLHPASGGGGGKQRHLYPDVPPSGVQPIYPAPDDDGDEESGDYYTHDEHSDPLHHLHHPSSSSSSAAAAAATQTYKHETMLLDLGPAQLDWFYELQSRGAMIVRVLFSRAANNDKELSVRRGEILEILDDSRKWWRARNIDLQVAHVPHTIVAPMQGYQTLDDLLANQPIELQSNGGGFIEDPSFMMTSSSSASLHYARHPASAAASTAAGGSQHIPGPDDHWNSGGRHNMKNAAAGAFRYF